MSGSLRLRLIATGVAAIVIALALAGWSLRVLFERHVSRAFTGELDVHLTQLIGGLDTLPDGSLVLTRTPADARFADPLSGLYWQVSGDAGVLLRSRSLWDTELALPADAPAPGQVHRHETVGPAGKRVLVAERGVTLLRGGQPAHLRVAVAINLDRITDARDAFTRDLVVALGVLAVMLVLATSAQVLLGLRPLGQLQRGLADIRAGRARALPSTAPAEVRPLVEEVNGLLTAQEQEIERARSHAADLAHGLKTPLAALAADARRLHERGDQEVSAGIQSAVDAMSRHVDRELARARVRGARRIGTPARSEVAPLVRSLVATLSRTPRGEQIAYEIAVPDSVSVPFDRVDLAEVLGNLLDNATRHARSHVRIAGGGDRIVIEDDGEGLADASRTRVLERGVRLDQRADGAGLGLAIVAETLEAYGWHLDLDRSALGGLRCTVSAN